MSLNQQTAQLVIKVTAQNSASAAINQLHNDFNNLKNKIAEVAGVLAIGAAFKSMVDETKQWAEQTRALQAELGVSAEMASRLNYAAQVFGISNEELTTSLGRLAKNMFSTSVEADKGKDAFTKWDIAIKDTHGSIRNIVDILGDAAQKVHDFGDGAATRALEMDLFGKAGGRLHELLMQGAAGVQELVKESDALGLTLSGRSLQAMYDFSIQSNKLGLAFDGLKVALGQALLPMLTALVQNLTKFVQWVISATKNSQLFAGVIKAVGEAFRYVGGLIKEFIDHVRAFAETIGTKGFGGAVLDLAGALKDMLLKALGDVGQKLDSFGPLGTIAKDALIAIGAIEVISSIEGVVSSIGKIASGIRALPAKTVLAFDLILVGLAVGEVVATVQEVTDKWEDWRTAAHRGLLENQGAVGDFVKGLVFWGDQFSSFGSAVNGMWAAVTAGVKKVFGDMQDFVRSKLFELIVDLDRIILKINEIAHTNIPPLGGGGDSPPPGNGGDTGSGGGQGDSNPHPHNVGDRNGDGAIWDGTGWVGGNSGGGGGGGLLGMARGGIVRRPTLAIIGESGPEAVIPLGGGRAGATINVYVSGNVTDSEQALADKIGDMLMKQIGHSRQMAF